VEPSLAVTASLAVMSLAAASAAFLGRVPRAIARIGMPRWPAAALLATLLTAAILRERPAAAEVPPPIVRMAPPAPSAGVPPPDPAPVDRYTVVAGDCLWRIARGVLTAATGTEPTSADIARFWPRIYEANRQVIGDDPDLILVGQVLLIPEV